MPGFGSGLATGILSGWSDQQAKQDDIKRQQKQQEIQNRISIMNQRPDPDATDEEKDHWSQVRQNAAQELQDLMQGKKPGGKSQGGLSPVLQNLLKMVSGSHQAQSGGFDPRPSGPPQMPGSATGTASNDRSLPGQPQTATAAPGQAPSSAMRPAAQQAAPQPSQLPTGPTGRPTLQGSGNAATDPANLPVAGAAPAPSGRAAQIENLRGLLANTTSPHAKQRIEGRIADLEDAEAKAQDALVIEAQRSTERAELEKIKAQNALEKQQAEERFKSELAKAAQVSKEAAQAEKEKHDKEMKDLEEKHKEDLRLFDVAHPLPTKPGKAAAPKKNTDAAAMRRKLDSINTWKENQYASLNKQLADAVAKGSMTRSAAATLRQTRQAEIQQSYLDRIKAVQGGGGGEAPAAAEERVPVISPDGKKGSVPKSQLQDAIQQGYKQAA